MHRDHQEYNTFEYNLINAHVDPNETYIKTVYQYHQKVYSISSDVR